MMKQLLKNEFKKMWRTYERDHSNSLFGYVDLDDGFYFTHEGKHFESGSDISFWVGPLEEGTEFGVMLILPTNCRIDEATAEMLMESFFKNDPYAYLVVLGYCEEYCGFCSTHVLRECSAKAMRSTVDKIFRAATAILLMTDLRNGVKLSA